MIWLLLNFSRNDGSERDDDDDGDDIYEMQSWGRRSKGKFTVIQLNFDH